MILRLLAASLRRRFRQTAVILVAVTVAAGTVAALGGVARQAAGGFDRDLAAFGPNLMVRPQVGGPAFLPADEVEPIRTLAGVVEVTPVPGAADDGRLERIELRVRRERLDAVAAEIEARVPGAEASPVLRVSRSETDLARRLTLLLAAVAAVACLLALLSVSASTTALGAPRSVCSSPWASRRPGWERSSPPSSWRWRSWPAWPVTSWESWPPAGW